MSFNVPQEFIKKLKIGTYKELHKNELITKEQLDALIELQRQINVSIKSQNEY